MSVQTMAAVWKGSQHSGSALLMMLAIADFSDDKGQAFPAVATLAEKTRMKPRNANYLLSELQASGELAIKMGAGPKGTNLYRIALDRLAGLHHSAGVHQGARAHCGAGLHPQCAHPCTGVREPLHPSADKPSMNHQEPSAALPAKLATCPVKELIKLFVEAVPELPRPRPELWVKSKAADAMRARWAWILKERRDDGERYASTIEEGLAWFAKFFARVGASDFLTGRNGKWTKCDLGWLMQPDNIRKVVEGNYTEREIA